tara:strand:- start:1481 stop:2428 length:948 start_codon:yes stop_codon:yes gene_type:complete
MDWKKDVTGLLTNSEQPLIVVLGPTASGKTAFSIDLARFIQSMGKGAEVINADSRQLYTHLTIGTAKVSAREARGVPHHLLDVLDPREEASAGWYQKEARTIIQKIHDEGSVPILVGGSMLYISSVIDSLSMAPTPEPEHRERLIREWKKDDGKTLYARLQEIDPKTAEKVHQNNMPRLVRAVEIFELLQEPKSTAVPKSELRSPEAESPYDLLLFGMQWERDELCARITKRTKLMFEEGWMEEVEDLLNHGYTAEDPALKSHGYREIIAYKEGSSDDLDSLQELIASKTRQYARRQMTWWKGDSRIQWLSQEVR